ncbi:MAG: peptide deformylase [Psychrobacter sp.]|jgi:peptide deformylase|uniref:peptide deformylase n=1 Tax=Psychrobacter TaxID=497 RepID=UPI000414183F|nr:MULTISPECIES: peptide deformylase [Psychrobacter]MAE39940.1 peptide deformylase [Psychrobacter sp.]HAM61447.1 peptide deformylase [Psychrobacter sp.]|tara:strand:- start:1298 stop:1849 length:552 start_codon:yes stop_codon:yes gene_type:complete
MAVLPILSYPDPRLRTIAAPVKEVDAEIKTLISDMIETMYAADGIGLAASQVDRHIQLIVMDLSENRDTPMVFINPKVTPLVEEKQPYEEGCLSVPDVYDKVERPSKVRIEALDADGEAIDEIAEGLLAVCIQHEMDHLNGVIFVDYLSRLKQTRARDKVKKVLKIREKQSQQAAKQPEATNV